MTLAAFVTAMALGLQGCARPPAPSLSDAPAARSAAPRAASAAPDVVSAKAACADLASVDLVTIGGAGSHITAAVETTNRAGTAVCAVEGVLAPAITFAVQLPTKSWSQRYLQVGCGGLCGSIGGNVGAADGCAPLNSGGFVLAATDMGHQDQDGSFGQDPVKRADFAYRAQHLTAVAAKALIRAFYGQPQKYAYFTGCSDGGREALIEAQRYPDDFDGIIAGAGALNFMAQNAVFHAWQARANTGADGKPILLADRLPILHKAVLAACDKLDGLADGLIGNPLACHFDPAAVRCPAGATDTAACLTAAETEVARKFYDGPHDAVTGKALTVGGPQPGSELAWAGVYVPQSASDMIFSEKVSLPVLRHMAFETAPPARFSLADMRFDLATFDRLRPRHRLFDATNPDLSAFANRGGKLIVWHGWSDPHISPLNSIAYYTAVRRFMGAGRTDAFARLYVLPGMYHCANGEGPHLIDLLTPMLAWVEGGKAPDSIQARQPAQAAASDFGAPRGTGGRPGGMGQRPAAVPGAQAAALGPTRSPAAAVERSRPVYPWPYVAVWDGQGDATLATSYRRGPASDFSMPDWYGADFFAPYEPAAH
ncbi:tannase/feruloyl esterase family alpha/beta hydrolase [Xanthomonas cassavae CFBP 4642]|uniref:Tannase/feruloyl esterase family alpha/beta hydrolase n=1 Tax=Xanthomonas cassavae CFBP 4642 TaxID=1219375 RepID=A0ABS8HF33_9XANT|nr:tannase/feruloyl esterase family alpha/beta hydrolase [Xanthomonas cassavae]MCC4620795.1 tannase/feruloyl esterase family alpha/beta hydrolase [Xanthomonas cassavae CFBP 4642]